MKSKKSTLSFLVFIFCASSLIFPHHAKACSTFMLKTKSQHVFGHNLSMGMDIPGLIFINKRGATKKGHTWSELTTPNMDNKSNISWVSNYGSVTFNSFGRELPDGGMNEEGLYVWEMTGISSFDDESKRPRLFMAQWIQYQLDNYKSVEEVLDNLPAIALDGWNWHFFVADKLGETASIEFIDGVTLVNTGNNMPIPLMGNGRYSDDISFIKEFDGFGGNIKIELNDVQLPGYIKAAKMMKDYSDSGSIVDYGFSILTQLSGNAKWSVIFDVKDKTVYFRTAKYANIKSFSMNSFDFSMDTPVKTLNIQDPDLSGDITGKFIDFNQENNHQLAMEITELIYTPEEFEISAESFAQGLAMAYQSDDAAIIKDIAGKWTGTAEYPTTGEPATVDWIIHIEEQNGSLLGRVTDSAGLLSETEMRNIVFKNGILRFTVYSYGYVFKIFACISDNGMEGAFDISNESRKGNFQVSMN